MDFSKFTICLVYLSIQVYSLELPGTTAPYDVLYAFGQSAYENHNWEECYTVMQSALDEYNSYHSLISECRLRCDNAGTTEIDPIGMVDLAFFEITMRRSNCLRQCKKLKLDGKSSDNVPDKVKQAFEEDMPYNYLQLCAFKSGKLEVAAAAAYTFLLKHPEHTIMQENLKIYQNHPDIKSSDFKNMEAKRYQDAYEMGVHAYGQEDWLSCVRHIEEALDQYFLEDRTCRARCQGGFEHTGQADFYSAIADHYASVLQCTQKCPTDLATLYNSLVEHFLPEMYNYLQFSYYRLGEFEAACEAVASYQLLNPADEVMEANHDFYMSMPSVSEDSFKPRKEAIRYQQRQEEENRLAEFVGKEYIYSEADVDLKKLMEEAEYPDDGTLPKSHPVPQFVPKDEAYKATMQAYKDKGIEVTMEGEELLGEQRMAADGIISQDQCQALMDLAKSGATQGDGYKGTETRSSPHTDFEKFEGLTVQKAAELTLEGNLPESSTRLYLSASDLARQVLQDYLGLTTPLYFHYTHLVCRTALQEQEGREDLSHPVHTDNCVKKPDGTCPRIKPAYIQRDYSALLYLNGDFTGGDFFFAHSNETVQKRVRPACGRMVGFSAGDYHAVKAITKGRRCAVAMWFTLDGNHTEQAHIDALRQLDSMNIRKKKLEYPKLRTMTEASDIQISLTEADLNGPERFAADRVASPAQCDELIRLANGAGQVGDGYQRTGKKAPFTEHEAFTGLTVQKAAEMASASKVSAQSARLYLDLSEKSRLLVETYFGLQKPLYFDYTHLVCRTALSDYKMVRTDLSHPIHSDNCNLQIDGSCTRVPPAYVQRDYSALLYLNGDFEGGDFFFSHPNTTEQASLHPQCGMLVGFNASNLHGVRAVVRGQRCALAMWYTFDVNYNEPGHATASKLLDEVEKRPLGPPQTHIEL